MKILFSVVAISGAVAVLLLLPDRADATLVTEYFLYNDSDSGSALNGPTFNGGAGWSGGWSGGSNSNDYESGGNLNYTGSGYSNTGNTAGTNNGGFGVDANTIGDGVRRDFSQMTGTVWISFLMTAGAEASNKNHHIGMALGTGDVSVARLDGGAGSTGDGFLLKYNGRASNVNYDTAGIQGPGSEANRFDGINDSTASGATADGTTVNLFLARLVIGANDLDADTLDLWVNPVDASLAALNADGTRATVSVEGLASGANFLDHIYIGSKDTGTNIDAIRFSDAGATDGLTEVLSGQPVPEPNSLVLLLFGSIVAVGRRKAARHTVRP